MLTLIMKFNLNLISYKNDSLISNCSDQSTRFPISVTLCSTSYHYIPLWYYHRIYRKITSTSVYYCNGFTVFYVQSLWKYTPIKSRKRSALIASYYSKTFLKCIYKKLSNHIFQTKYEQSMHTEESIMGARRYKVRAQNKVTAAIRSAAAPEWKGLKAIRMSVNFRIIIT